MTELLHADRFSSTTTLRKNGVIVHDSEGAEGELPWGVGASDQLIAALAAPGDRPSPSRPGGFYGSGYHAVAEEDGTYRQLASAAAAPYAAPPCNPTWWHICIPGKAAQTLTEWIDGPSRAYRLAVARFIVDKHRADGFVWPLQRKLSAEMRAGDHQLAGHPCGYSSHAEVSKAWGQTDHTDPGSSFPWNLLALDIIALTSPQPGDLDMTEAKLIQPDDGDPAVYALTGICATWIDNEADLDVARVMGTVAKTTELVPRTVLKSYRLLGPLPHYASPPAHATVASDFRSLIP